MMFKMSLVKTSPIKTSLIRISLVLIAAAVCVCPWVKPVDAAAARQIGDHSAGGNHSTKGSACPSSAVVETELGNASGLLDQAQYQETAEMLKSQSLLRCDPRASLLLAAALEAQGNLPAAEQALQESHAQWPANDSIAASLAREYLNSGQADKALQALAGFHATSSTRLQELQLAAVVYMTANKLAPAQAVAEMAYRTYPSLDTLLLLANVLQLEGKYPAVNRLLGGERATYAYSAKFLITLAESEYDAAMWTPAGKDAERAISLDNSLFQAHYILGNVLVKQGDLDRAATAYLEAIKLAPGEPRTYFHLALVYRAKNDTPDEEHALEQALAANDHYAPAHSEMGKILIEQGKFEDAVSHLKLAVQYNPNSEQAYFLLVRAYAKLGEKSEADAMVKRLAAVRKANRRGQVE
jgi:tetratricopeptide (TPR) repeat protein